MSIQIRKVTAPVAIRSIILVFLALLGGFGVAQQVYAAQSPTSYCNQYPADNGDTLLRSACSDGLKIAEGKGEGATCKDYAIMADQATVDVCNKAISDRTATKSGAADIVSGGAVEDQTTSPSPSPTASASTSPNSISGSIQDALDATKGLSDFIDVLHKAGTDAKANMNKADNEYGNYINGAGNRQKIKVYPNPNSKGKAPALIIINGGGWHGNDHNSDFIMNNQPDVVHGATQVGPTPLQRGYVGFDLTYRLGSSGVYYMFEDVMRGIKHIRENADMYGIDPNKIVIWGDSAGGSLAVRAAASGKTGAKAAVGWSPPTNAYTALFRSYKSLMIGMDHSTCIPTDLAGAANITDLLNGGSGNVAEYGQGLSSNDFSFLGIQADGVSSDPLSTVLQVLTAGQYAYKTGQNIESISQQLESAYNNGKPSISSISGSGLASGIINMSSKKLIECIDNFNVMSPALFASPDSPPMFLAGFTTDDVVNPNQVTGMREKLDTLGIKNDGMLIPGSDNGFAALGPNPGNHLDYDARFVCPTLNFIDSIVQPDHGKTDCETGQSENLGSAGGSSGGGSCSARVDSEIRLRNVQSAKLSAAVITQPGGSASNTPPNGTTTEGPKGTKNKPGVLNKDPLKEKSDTVEINPVTNDTKNNQSNSSSSSGASGGGSGSSSGSGGSGCASSGSGSNTGTPSTSASPEPSTGTKGDSKSDTKSSTDSFTSIFNNLGSILGGLGGFNGFGGNGSGGSGNSDGSGEKANANGARGGAKFTASQTSGSCQIDYSRVTQLGTAGNGLVTTCGQQLSFITAQLSDVIHAKPVQMLIVPTGFSDTYLKSDACQSGARGVAYAMYDVGRIYFCADYLSGHQDDLGMAVHETVHLTQGYKDAPGWVTEGIADYVRAKYEPNNPSRLGCDATDTYTTGYTCTAALFVYIERQYNKPGLVKSIHTKAKTSNFTLSLITAGTGKTIDQLFKECQSAECKR